MNKRNGQRVWAAAIVALASTAAMTTAACGSGARVAGRRSAGAAAGGGRGPRRGRDARVGHRDLRAISRPKRAWTSARNSGARSTRCSCSSATACPRAPCSPRSTGARSTPRSTRPPPTVNVARAGLDAAVAALDNAALEVSRARNLYEKGALPKQRLDAADTQRRAAQAQRDLGDRERGAGRGRAPSRTRTAARRDASLARHRRHRRAQLRRRQPGRARATTSPSSPSPT